MLHNLFYNYYQNILKKIFETDVGFYQHGILGSSDISARTGVMLCRKAPISPARDFVIIIGFYI